MKKRTRRLPKGVYLRGTTFYVVLCTNGQRIRKAAGPTLEDALRLLSELEAEHRPPARVNGTGRSSGPTLDSLIERYLERTRLYSKPSSIQSAESSCRRLKEHLGKRRVDELDAQDLERFIAARLSKVSREAVNRDLRYLKAALRLAVEEGLIERPPFKVTLLRTTRKLPTILSPEELSRLFKAADDRLRPLLMTAAMAGLRHSELAALDWSDIDLRGGFVSVRAKPEIGFSPKSHAERRVPLNDKLIEILTNHRAELKHHGPTHPVFQRNQKTASRWEASALCAAVRKVFRKAGLYQRDARPGLHMLRRSFASHALGRQADIETVRELGGWSGLAVVERYVASTEELKRRAVSRLEFS